MNEWRSIDQYFAIKHRRTIDWDRILCYGKLPWTTVPVVFCAHAHPTIRDWAIDGAHADPGPALHFNPDGVVTLWMPLPEAPE